MFTKTSLIASLIIIVLIMIFILMRSQKFNGVKIIRYQFCDRSVKGDTNILPENISSTNPRKSALFKVFLEIENVSEPPEIGISKDGVKRELPNIKDHIVNINSGKINENFIFDAELIVRPNENINFQVKKDTVIKLFFLGEFYIP